MRAQVKLFTIPLDLERAHHFSAMARAAVCKESGFSHGMDLPTEVSRQQATRLDVN
jgi:hypothetical protein